MSEKDQFHQQNDLFYISSSNLTRFQTFSIELGLLQYISHVLIIIGFILIELAATMQIPIRTRPAA